jgi:Zn-dependent protease/CBS domain-containing protein
MHWTFLILIAWVVLEHAGAGAGVGQIAVGVGLVLAVFGCVVLHELGHALAARRYGIATRDITLLPIGGVARLERMPEDPRQELVVAAAGPAVNVAIAGLLYLLLSATGGLRPIAELTRVGGSFLPQLLWVNLFIVGFNLLPAFPMDGGRLLRALLALRLPYRRATRIAAKAGQLMAVLFGFWGLTGGNPFLLFIALFVFLGAQGEAQQVELRLAIEGVTVREAMMTRFTALADTATLGDAAEELLAGAQQDFPIVSGGRLLGVLSRADLVKHLKERGREVQIGPFVTGECQIAVEHEPLEEALARMRETRCATIPVVRGGVVVGLVTMENVSELMMIGGSGE